MKSDIEKLITAVNNDNEKMIKLLTQLLEQIAEINSKLD